MNASPGSISAYANGWSGVSIDDDVVGDGGGTEKSHKCDPGTMRVAPFAAVQRLPATKKHTIVSRPW
jgi:hypothetical protein